MIPELEPHCGSWIATNQARTRVLEFFERADAERAARLGWRVETAAQYLGRINRELRIHAD